MDEARKPFWAMCGKCSHCWTLFYAPMELAASAKIMKRASCPMCGASGKSILVAKQDDGVLLEGKPAPSSDGSIDDRAQAWRQSGDVGMSSKALWSVMMGVESPDGSHPHDGDDLGRCIRLLDLIPEWRPRIHLMAGRSKYWAALVEKWDALEASYRRGDDWQVTYTLMRSLLDPVEQADPRVVRMGSMTVEFRP